MSKFTTIAAVALSSTLAFGAASAAGHHGAAHHGSCVASDNHFHYGLSAVYQENNYNPGAALGFEVQNKAFEAGVSASVFRFNDTSASTSDTDYELGAHIGFRHKLRSRVTGSVGFNAQYFFVQNATAPTNHRPYGLGAYLGLSYDVAAHTEVFARINPVSYVRNEDDDNIYEFFKSGSIGVAYFF